MQAGRVLVVEDDTSLRNMLCMALRLDGYDPVEAPGGRLHEALRLLEESRFDAILLDLTLPDSDGIETVTRIHAHSPEVPVVVMTGASAELGLAALREGAQDYLVKGEIDLKWLSRALRYAAERHRLQAAIRELSIRDELTGLHNRRGFLIMAEQQLKTARRSEAGCALVFMDLDGLKAINDRLGHLTGDRALQDTAAVLRETFRAADVVARMGGDEFVALLIGINEADGARTADRLRERLSAYNQRTGRPYQLSFSVGVVWFDPQQMERVDDVLDAADRAMYEQKRRMGRPKAS